MTDKQNNPDPIAHAARLLREAAEELRQAHAYHRSEGWQGETGAQSAYDVYMAAAQALEDWEAAGAGGAQALSAAPAGWKLVPVEPTVDQEWAGKNAALRCSTMGEACKIYKAMLAASPTPPAEQPAPNTGHAEADRLIGRLMSSDPDFEDCRQAAELIQREIKGPDGFGTWREAAIAERLTRVNQQAAPKATTQQEVQEPCPTCAALARTVMLDQVSFDRKPDCYGIRQITDDEGVEEWEDIRTSPDVAREEANDMMATGRGEIYEVVPLWTTPRPAPAPLSEREEIAMIDAAMVEMANIVPPLKRSECARLIRAALAAQGGQ